MRKTLIPSLLLLLLPLTSSAEITARPGLWEITTSSALLGMVPEVPPQQLQKLTKLAKQYGVVMPKIQNGAATSRICVTPEMAGHNIPDYFHQRQSGCNVSKTAETENSYKADVVCSGAQIKGNGKAEGTFVDSETFSGYTEFNGTVAGTPIKDRADTTGRWIGEHCKTAQPADGL
ncbi:MAG TPA: DUF3617 domain-containing protein [Nitrosospira sp.]|nr:DUF3617 domain-containing protein [Nitrosospira sp.]